MGFTIKQVEKIIRDGTPGAFADEAGLYLKIGPTGAASWQYRFQINGKRRMMGLGACAVVTLAEARDKAADARKQVKAGIDPLEAAKAAEIEAQAEARTVTFKELAREYIADHRAGWRSAKHAQQWENTLETYVFKKIGGKHPAAITTEDVLGVLKPIWTKKPETASRVRNRIELIIDAARAKGFSAAANPAAWRGHLDKLLPKRTNATRGHHAAMSYQAIPAFFARLTDDRTSLSSVALQVTILTACRTSEVLLAEWSEFDLENRMWIIPGERMKAGRPHRVPLSDTVLALLNGIKGRSKQYVFPGARTGRPLSNMAMTSVLRNLGHNDLTVHGFRSTFRDWCAEETHYANIIAEQALAHTVGDKVEAAYRRGDLLEKRRALMADWASYCTTKPAANVIPIGSKSAA